MSSVLSRLVISVVGDNRELKKSLTDTEKQLNKQTKLIGDISKKMATAGKLMTLGITLPILGIGTAMAKTAMEAVESENLFEVSMGNMAKAARDWSVELSKSLGLNQYEIRQNVGTMNVMLKSMGLAEDASYDMAKGLTQLAYDMASFYNLNPEEAFQKLQAGITGETEPLKRLGIVINETAIKTYALKEGIIEQGETMTEQEKILARYGAIMEFTSAAQGDLARTMDSPSNKLKILQSRVKETATSFGMLLLPTVSKFLDIANTWAEKIQGLSEDKKQLIIRIALLAAAIGPAMIAISKMIQVVVGLRNAILLLSAAEKTSFLFKGGGLFIALAGAITQTGSSVQYMGDGLRKLETIIYRAETGFDRLKKGNEGYNEAVEKAQITNDELLLSIQGLADTYPLLADETVKVYESWKNGTITLDEYNIELKNLIENRNEYIVKSGEFDSSSQENAKSIEQLTDSFSKGEISIDEYINSMAGMEGITDDTTDAIDIFAQGLFTAYLNTINLRDGLEEARAKLAEYDKAVEENGKFSEEAKDKRDEFIRVLDSLSTNQIPAVINKQGELSTSDLALLGEWDLMVTKAGEMGISIPKEYEEMKKAAKTKVQDSQVLYFQNLKQSMYESAVEAANLRDEVAKLESKKITVSVEWKDSRPETWTMYKKGGVIGYASGGIIGHEGFIQPLLKASAGMITPSYDNGGILTMLHKNEVVLNSKQTRNLAELIFGLANTPQNIEGTGTGGQPINITNNIELDGEVIYQKTSKYLYDNQRSKQIGMGMR